MPTDRELSAEVARLRETVRRYELTETRLRERVAELEVRQTPYCPHVMTGASCIACEHEATRATLEDVLVRLHELEAQQALSQHPSGFADRKAR